MNHIKYLAKYFKPKNIDVHWFDKLHINILKEYDVHIYMWADDLTAAMTNHKIKYCNSAICCLPIFQVYLRILIRQYIKIK